MNEVILDSARASVGIRPDLGGAISHYRSRREGRAWDWMRPLPRSHPGGLPAAALAAACFPLVPFSGRIRDGRFPFRGREVQLAPNFPPERHTIHGHGWQAAWEVAEHANGRAVLEYRHEADAWPWDYRARQTFELAGEVLAVTLAIVNEGEEAMPAGLGLHPYFARTQRARIEASVHEVWETDEEVMPVRRAPAPPKYPLEAGITADAGFIDNAFSGWSGRARIVWPELDATLHIEAGAPLHHLVVFTPVAQDFFCVEPVSHATDAFNMMARGEEGHGALVLSGGDSLTARVVFRPDW